MNIVINNINSFSHDVLLNTYTLLCECAHIYIITLTM